MTSTTGIRPIPTRYAGCHFRSRLEARWAVFFDTLGVQWAYEPQGYHLPTGQSYLPDFWLPAVGCWFEVKGTEPATGSPETTAAFALAVTQQRPVFIAWGDLPRSADVSASDRHDIELHHSDGGWDCSYRWCACPSCLTVGLSFAGRVERLPCNCLDPSKDNVYDDGVVVTRAYAAARSARFEHGHEGAS